MILICLPGWPTNRKENETNRQMMQFFAKTRSIGLIVIVNFK